MSQKSGPVDGDAGETKSGLTMESLQQYLAAQAEDRDAAAERTESILARFFKVGIVIVCLNVVIAGANVAMIMIRPSAPPSMPLPLPVAVVPPVRVPPAAPALVPEPVRPAPIPQTPASESQAEPQAKIAAQVKESPTKVAAALPTPSVPEKAVEKRVPLLGPLPSSSKPLPVLARRVPQPIVRSMLPKPSHSDEVVDEERYDSSSAPPERW